MTADARATTIYALCEPATMEVRYIGKTIGTLRARLNGHVRKETNCHSSRWIKSIKPNIPEILELETTSGDWREAEQHWISYMKYLGANLTNITPGGGGYVGFKLSDEQKQKLLKAITGRKKSQEEIGKIVSANTGRVHSEESKSKMSIAKKGKLKSAETRANMSKAQTGRVLSAESRAKITTFLTGRKWSQESIDKRNATFKANRLLSEANGIPYGRKPEDFKERVCKGRRWQARPEKAI